MSGILGAKAKGWSPGDSVTKVASSRSFSEDAGVRVDSEEESFKETDVEVELAVGEPSEGVLNTTAPVEPRI